MRRLACRITGLVTSGLVVAAALAADTLAQSATQSTPVDPVSAYPSRTVRLISPFPAGSNADSVARIIGDPLQKIFGQPFLVENKAGATGSIAAEFVAKSTPDGYTLFVTTNSPLVVNGTLFKKLGYDPVEDFIPIVRFGVTGFVVMVKPELKITTLAGLIELAKSRPGKLTAGSGGAGGQVSAALLNSMAGIDVAHVPYRGVPQAVTDVLGGSLDYGLVDLGNAIPQMQSASLRALAHTLSERTPLAPGVQTVAETLPGFEVTAWFGLVAPAATPAGIVEKLREAAMGALARPEVQAAFANTGNVVAPMGPAEFSRFIVSEIPKWEKLVKLSGLHPE